MGDANVKVIAGMRHATKNGARTRVAALCSRAVLLGAALVCGAVITLVLTGSSLHRITVEGVLILIIAPSAALIALAYISLWQRESVIRRIAVELPMLGLSLIIVEVLIVIWTPVHTPQEIRELGARKRGVAFDSRTVSEVVAQLQNAGVDALPGTPLLWLGLSSVRERLPDGFFPFSHASHAAVVECNERGEYLVYRTDEFGFNNPPGLLASNQVDIAAVGESLTLGHCLPPAQSLIGLLRKRYARTANFAMAGNRILMTLGSFREYVEPLRPAVVLWAMDMTMNHEVDFKEPLLARYLEPAFSQHLRERQREVDRIVRTIAVPAQAEIDRLAKLSGEERRAERLWRFARIPGLWQLRSRVLDPLLGSQDGPVSDHDLQPVVATLKIAKEATERWGGAFVVLLLPGFNEVVVKAQPRTLRHDYVVSVLTQNGIAVLDGVQLFLGQRDPAALYTMGTIRVMNHPAPKGQALLANFVITELERRFPRRLAVSPDS